MTGAGDRWDPGKVRARAVPASGPAWGPELTFDHEVVVGGDFSGLRLNRFVAINSRFEGCRFDGMRVEHMSFGEGMLPSVYLGCSFDGAQLECQPGGVVRLERCSFDKTAIKRWKVGAADLVDCVFTGTIRHSMFYGRMLPDAWARRVEHGVVVSERNEVRGNDFSGAKLIDVSFRRGVDLRLQRLPEGPEFLYVEQAASVLERARPVIEGWQDVESRKKGLTMVKVLSGTVGEGQEQLFVRTSEWGRPEVWDLLRELSKG